MFNDEDDKTNKVHLVNLASDFSQFIANGIEDETVDGKQNITSTPSKQGLNENYKELNKEKKLSEYKLQQLDKIKNDVNFKNNIIQVHNKCITNSNRKGIQFWKNYDSSNIYYRINAFTKKKKFNANNDLYSLLGAQIEIYDTIVQVQFFYENALLLIIDY